MKIIMVAVASVNGKITKSSDPNIYSWTSKEDSKLFFSLIEKNNLIIMGSKTYESARRFIKHKKNRLRIVLTKNPERYLKESIKGMLEFTNEDPLELIEILENNGYRKMLVVGGGTINALFLKSKLVNEIYLTIEPKIFGQGKELIGEKSLSVDLKLIDVKKLNKQGTLLLRYKMAKEE
ncbi:MAG: dihydrofolate reductase family protein [Candidatus Levybacteria bacterium]|nr:dihydrofolate reductase family protein [Candidatus Levybacteria bacterium]